MPRLSKKRFFQWARKHENEPVIKTKYVEFYSQCCPIARYAKSEGFRSISVSDRQYSHGRAHTNEALPDWACTVVALADAGVFDRVDKCHKRPIRDLLKELRAAGVRP